LVHTPYAALAVEDLVDYALNRDNRSDLEIELAQRLAVALAMLAEAEEFPMRPQPYGHDA
jgi:hypothetical protein